MKRQLSYSLIFLFLCTILTAGVIAPPRVETVTLDAGQSIQTDIPQYVNFNKTLAVNFWVYNVSDGRVMTNVTTSCSLYLINTTGHITLRLTSYEEKNIIVGGFPDWLCKTCFHTEIDPGNFTFIGPHAVHIKCNSSTIGGTLIKEFYVTKNDRSINGYIQEDGLITTLFVLLFMVLMGLLIYTFIDMLAHVLSLDYDLIDVAKTTGLYFFVLAFYVMNKAYLGDMTINYWLEWCITIGIFTHVVLPIINLGIMLVLGQYIKQRLYHT